ncbi:MAG: twin-arginine translocase subunit TatC [Acidobacteriota bacterium]
MATIFTEEEKDVMEEESSMSFLEHLDELRSRLIRIAAFVLIAFVVSWFFSDRIYKFLQVPVLKAMVEAKREYAKKLIGAPIQALADMPDGAEIFFAFPKEFRLGEVLIPPGTSILVKVQRDDNGLIQLLTTKPWIVNENTILKEGYVLPREFYDSSNVYLGLDNQLVVGNVQGAFNLYIKVAFFAAIFFAVPFILVQAWGFIAPGLYPHEKKYAMPLIIMASVFFILGCAFAYYIAFPRAANFLLGVAAQGDLRPLVTADEYFDLIMTITLGLGVVFEIPAVTFFLARLGLVSHKLLLKVWRVAIIVIFIVAAILSPTTDVPNLLVFAAPMMLLYFFSVGIAWVFHKDRQKE